MPDGVFVHGNGLCESDTVGSGTRVWAFAHVLPGAVVGRDCNICDGAYVEGGATVGDRVTIKNQVMIFEGVTIEDDVFLGPGVIFTNDFTPRAFIKKHGDELDTTTVRRGATLGAGRRRGLRDDDRRVRVRGRGSRRDPRRTARMPSSSATRVASSDGPASAGGGCPTTSPATCGLAWTVSDGSLCRKEVSQ